MGDSVTRRSYTDWLPTVALSYDVTDNIQRRPAVNDILPDSRTARAPAIANGGPNPTNSDGGAAWRPPG